jgi:thioredoxin-like negative regulator of GroEL
MLERLVVLVVFGAMVGVVVVTIRAWNARRVKALMQRAPLWAQLGEAPDGRRTLITFSSPSCAACHTAQAPAVAAVEQRVGSAALRVIRIDVAEQPALAHAFGVMTVPSTVVLAPAGNIVAINQGFAPTNKLVEQITHCA